jgi:hypothetical protein
MKKDKTRLDLRILCIFKENHVRCPDLSQN